LYVAALETASCEPRSGKYRVPDVAIDYRASPDAGEIEKTETYLHVLEVYVLQLDASEVAEPENLITQNLVGGAKTGEIEIADHALVFDNLEKLFFVHLRLTLLQVFGGVQSGPRTARTGCAGLAGGAVAPALRPGVE
jgi:hypothetical protein